jgi:Transglycosylase SLT domain
VRVILLSLLGMLLAPAQSAAAIEPGGASVVVDCRSAAAASEQSAGLPPGLLLAIGQVESGRWDPLAGRTDPWPWATNHAGEGHYFASAQEATAWVAAQLASGIQSIDVGCFQVNLFYHPDAFANLAEAFDPAANARYAAAFLNRLHDQSGSWPAAIALYHSADPSEGQRYSSRVMEAWHGGISIAAAPPFIGSTRPASPVVVRISTMASAVRVVVPNWTMPSSLASAQRVAGLPRVITPSH